MRLIDTLCAGHCRYERPIPTVPDILLLDIAAKHRAASLPLGRFYPIIVATDDECGEVETFLTTERTAVVAPDILDRRPSRLHAKDILFCRYDPPSAGWPWLLLCHWPSDCTGFAGDDGQQFARGVYTIEIFDTLARRASMESDLFGSLGRLHPIEIVAVPGNTTPGHA